MNRAELARSIMAVREGPARQGAARGRGGARLAQSIPRDVDPRALLELVQPEDAGPLEAVLADTSVDAAERLALAIGGPAFQWR
jgi:hypothetical protein